MHIKATGLLLAFAFSASASTITVNTNDRGYYYSYDYNLPSNQNYLTGQLNTGSVTGFHSFFEFNGLTGLSGPIVSATLYLYNPAGGFVSSQSSETLTIDGFTGNITTLDTAGGNPTGGTVTGEYNALAVGTIFGTQTVNAASDNTFVAITLNAAAIAFLNSSGGSSFAVGGYLSGIPGTDTTTRDVFSGTAFTTPTDGNSYLTVVTSSASTPEPGTWFLVVPGLMGLLALARRRRAGIKT